MKNQCFNCDLTAEEKTCYEGIEGHNCHDYCIKYTAWKDGLDIGKRGKIEYLASKQVTAGLVKQVRKKNLREKRGRK